MSVTSVDHLIAEAIFASDLQPSQHPDIDALATAAAQTLQQYGCTGCAALVAAEFGEHPDVAVARMQWALAAEQAYRGGAR